MGEDAQRVDNVRSYSGQWWYNKKSAAKVKGVWRKYCGVKQASALNKSSKKLCHCRIVELQIT